METCTHPNIVPFFGVVVDDTPAKEPLYLAMQYIESGTLQDLIYGERHAAVRTDDSRLPLPTQLLALVGMFCALQHLASLNLIHRDVKPANILVVVERGQLIKVLLADFGEAKQLTASMSRVSGAGTPVYMAPEMGEEDEAKTPKADTFSVGIVAVEMSTGKSPKPGPAMRKEGRRRVGVPEEERRAEDMALVRHPEILRIVQRCIVDDDEARADATEMLLLCQEMLEVVQTPAESTLWVQHTTGRTEVVVLPQTTMLEVKEMLEAQTGVAVAAQRLLFAGRPLEDHRCHSLPSSPHKHSLRPHRVCGSAGRSTTTTRWTARCAPPPSLPLLAHRLLSLLDHCRLCT